MARESALLSPGYVDVILYDLMTGDVDVIASYPSSVSVTSISAMKAPSTYGPDAYIFYAIIDNDHIDSYVQPSKHAAAMGPYTVRPPSAFPNRYLLDDENFVANDESYITITMGSDIATNPAQNSEIWVARAIPGGACDYRRVSGPNPLKRRNDPEPLEINGQWYIFYRELVQGSGRNDFVLHRAATGL